LVQYRKGYERPENKPLPEADRAGWSKPQEETPKQEATSVIPSAPESENTLLSRLQELQRAEDLNKAAQQAAQEDLARHRAAQHAHMASLSPEEQMAQMPNLSQSKRDWLRNNLHAFQGDNLERLGHAHYQATEVLKIPDDSPGYFQHIANTLNAEPRPFAPDPVAKEEPVVMQSPPPTPKVEYQPIVSAPVHREAVSLNDGKPMSTRSITLTPEQRDIARKSMAHLPPSEAERIYAQGLVRLNAAKQAGFYTTDR
jgi:hypothetical protein